MHYDGKKAPGVVVPFLAVSGGVLLEIVADIHFHLGPDLELSLPVVVGVHVREDQNPELLSKKQDTLNVKKIGGRRWQAIPCVILFVAHDSCHIAARNHKYFQNYSYLCVIC